MFSTQILIEVEAIKPNFKVDTEVCTMDIINMKINHLEVDEETLEEEEVVDVVVEVIEVNNQIMTQIATTARNMGTWQVIVIKGNMMHECKTITRELCIN